MFVYKKVKFLFEDDYEDLEESINELLKELDSNSVVDIKIIDTSDDEVLKIAMVIYEVEKW